MSDDSSAQTPPNMIAKFLIDISSYEDNLRGSVRRFHAQSCKRRPLLPTVPPSLSETWTRCVQCALWTSFVNKPVFPRPPDSKLKARNGGWATGERIQITHFTVINGRPSGSW